MSTRLQGLLLAIGAFVAAIGSLLTFLILGPYGANGPDSVPANAVLLLGGLILLPGLPVLSRGQARQIGILGLIGVALLCFAALALLLVLSGVQLVDVLKPGSIPHPGGDGPPPAALIPGILGVIANMIGGVMLGIALLRTHVFARAIGWALIITAVLEVVMNVVGLNGGVIGNMVQGLGDALFYASLAWAGAVLSTRKETSKQVAASPVVPQN